MRVDALVHLFDEATGRTWTVQIPYAVPDVCRTDPDTLIVRSTADGKVVYATTDWIWAETDRRRPRTTAPWRAAPWQCASSYRLAKSAVSGAKTPWRSPTPKVVPTSSTRAQDIRSGCSGDRSTCSAAPLPSRLLTTPEGADRHTVPGIVHD